MIVFGQRLLTRYVYCAEDATSAMCVLPKCDVLMHVVVVWFATTFLITGIASWFDRLD